MTTTFDVGELPSLDYLLEEDLDTIAFTPLSTGPSADRYRSEDEAKPKIGDAGVHRLHPNQEMLARIRGLVLDGIQIVIEDVSLLNCYLKYTSLTSTLRSKNPKGPYQLNSEKIDSSITK